MPEKFWQVCSNTCTRGQSEGEWWLTYRGIISNLLGALGGNLGLPGRFTSSTSELGWICRTNDMRPNLHLLSRYLLPKSDLNSLEYQLYKFYSSSCEQVETDLAIISPQAVYTTTKFMHKHLPGFYRKKIVKITDYIIAQSTSTPTLIVMPGSAAIARSPSCLGLNQCIDNIYLPISVGIYYL